MPICIGCGGSYDDNFKFCPYCGRAKPQPERLQISVELHTTNKWETCKVVRSVFRTDVDGKRRIEEGYFYADAVGMKGGFTAGDSPVFGNRWYWQDSQWHWANSEERAALDFLVNQLVRDGWEPTGASSEWWEKHFRRSAGQEYPNPWVTWEVVVWGHSLVKSRFCYSKKS